MLFNIPNDWNRAVTLDNNDDVNRYEIINNVKYFSGNDFLEDYLVANNMQINVWILLGIVVGWSLVLKCMNGLLL